MRRVTVAALLFLCIGTIFADDSASTIGAADASIGVIIYAEGLEVTIVRQTRLRTLEVDLGEAFGEPLYAGDQVSTGNGTTAEIQFLTSRNIVKLAENTTITVGSLVPDGETRVDLTFGRIRAQVAALTGTQRFDIHGMTSVAGVRGTDFGYDQVLDPATGQVLDRVYCFDGEVRVSAAADPSLATAISTGQMLVSTQAMKPQDVRVEPVTTGVTRYWQSRPFTGEARAIDDILELFPSLSDRVVEERGSIPSALAGASADAGQSEATSGRTAPDGATTATDTVATDATAETKTSVAAEEPGTGESPGEGTSTSQDGPAVTRIDRTNQNGGAIVPEDGTPADADSSSGSGPTVQNVLAISGVTLAAAGFVTDIAAVTLYFFGDRIPGWTSSATDLMTPIVIGGIAGIGTGLLMLVISLAFGQ